MFLYEFLSEQKKIVFILANFTMATSDEIELEVEKLMVSSSLDALCHVAQELDLDKKYWKEKTQTYRH